MNLLDLLRRGATIDAAASGAGLDREMAAIMVDHYQRAGLIELPRAAACTDCGTTARRPLGCAGCPFAEPRRAGSRDAGPSTAAGVRDCEA